MAVEIPVPQDSYPRIDVTLSGISYSMVFKENSRELTNTDIKSSGRLYFDIYKENTLIKAGVKIMEEQSLLSRYLLDDFSHGDIFCFRNGNDKSPVGKHNIGIGKSYGLYYVTKEEVL